MVNARCLDEQRSSQRQEKGMVPSVPARPPTNPAGGIVTAEAGGNTSERIRLGPAVGLLLSLITVAAHAQVVNESAAVASPVPMSTATQPPTPASAPVRLTGCAGDCSSDGAVSVDEIVRGLNIILGLAPLTSCSVLDADSDGNITINELVAAVNNALRGCSAPGDSTPTEMPTHAPSNTPTGTTAPTRTRTVPSSATPVRTPTRTAIASPTGGEPRGPTACETQEDCAAERARPPDATMGCACSLTPQGNMCVPKCITDADCPKPPDQILVCSSEGVCVPDGAPTPGPTPGDGGGMSIDDTISDQAQSMTIAFDGLAFVTGSFCAQTFYPPGKVADFFGFQYLRDNDPSGMGHNTDFTTLTADPVLVLLHDAQLTTLSDLGTAEATLNDQYGYARFPLAKAFRRLIDGEVPAGHAELSREAVKAYSAYLFGIDGEMSYRRAQAYASVLGSMDASQQAVLDGMKGKGSLEWTQPTQTEVDAVLARYLNRMMRTYAGEMLAWYLGSKEADVYFCPERQGTYFGSFFMKDIKAMHNPSYTIDSNMTAEMGDAFLAELSAEQQDLVTGLVTEQKTDLLAIVAKREEIAATLRNLLSTGGTVDEATVINLAKQYGELDGEISYNYAINFSAVGESLTTDQKSTLMTLRKTATAEDDGSADYDDLCGNGYLYSEPLAAPSTVMNTDFLFGVCAAATSACSTDWDCCSFACLNHVCETPFTFTSTAFEDGGSLPVQYTCDDAAGGVSPPLQWTVPEGTVEFALTMTTVALDGTKYNWVLFHLPSTVTLLAQGGVGIGTTGLSTDGPLLKYYPPCSTGPGTKTYTFTLYALSAAPTFTVPESQVNGEILSSAIGPLTIAGRQVNVSYTRSGL
jgi:phosphatidylethanolamine-binding protein (PEBP) family uncharacterized protein